MRERVIARRYARALFGLTPESGRTAEVVAATAAFARLFETETDLRRLLLHPGVAGDVKTALVGRLVADETAREFLTVMMAKHRLVLLPLVAAELGRMYREAEGVVEAEVATAVPLDGEMEGALRGALERLTGKRVELTRRLEPALIGGVRLRVGDRVVDGTVAGYLREIREAMGGVSA